mgnify:CR=1 FL=1
MKKINRFLMIYMVVITVLCICMCYLAFSEVRSQITTTAEKKQTKAVKKVKATYSLKILDGSLAVINNKTKEVFEYTDMKKENLPADIKNMLKENFIFENREGVNLLMAVLEKRVGLQLGGCDAYVNLAGGMKLGEPAIDLGIIMAIASSYKNRPILEDTIIFGEVGLVGEVRAVSGGEARIKEAQKLGFKRCILPQANVDQIKVQTDMRLVGVSNVMEALDLI